MSAREDYAVARVGVIEAEHHLRDRLDPDAAEWVTRVVVEDWLNHGDRGHDRGAWTAATLTYRAARLRRQGRHDVADVLAEFAELAVVHWADDVLIRSLVADLASLPSAVERLPAPD